MRDKWYGDKRDVVKWGAILFLSTRCSITKILHVALYRPDRKDYKLRINGTQEPLPKEVIEHFHNLDQIQLLARNAQVTIDVHKNLFKWNRRFRTRQDFRKSYFDRVGETIMTYRERVIVFLDPDTGIAGETDRYELVNPEEIRIILGAMKPGDFLLFYQHARRGDKHWRINTETDFIRAVGTGVLVETITCQEIAKDVAFFAVERNKRDGDSEEKRREDSEM